MAGGPGGANGQRGSRSGLGCLPVTINLVIGSFTQGYSTAVQLTCCQPSNRTRPARGKEAAIWAVNRGQPGLFDMQDVLGLNA